MSINQIVMVNILVRGYFFIRVYIYHIDCEIIFCIFVLGIKPQKSHYYLFIVPFCKYLGIYRWTKSIDTICTIQRPGVFVVMRLKEYIIIKCKLSLISLSLFLYKHDKHRLKNNTFVILYKIGIGYSIGNKCELLNCSTRDFFFLQQNNLFQTFSFKYADRFPIN